MSEFLQRVENAVSERHLFVRGQKILAAVSGGVDSMVLLQVLQLLARKHHWKILVAHFNHRLRGRASDADERLVRRTASKLGLECVVDGADVKQTAARSKLSIEMAARKLRHEFLARAARQHEVSTIALAHHADDQVELFFLRLLRGTGGEGLAGMRWRSPSPADRSVFLVRPLLQFSKAELLAWARENPLPFREDATNLATDFLRNRVRHELLPLLREKYQAAVDKLVLRLMDIVGAETEFVGAAAKQFRSHRSPRARAKIGNFDGLPLAVQRQVLRQQLAGFGLLPDFELIEQLRKVPARQVSVCAGLCVSRDPAGALHCREELAGEFDPSEIRLALSSGRGRVQFGGSWFHWRREPVRRLRLPPKKKPGASPARREWFDADKIGREIILRHWRPGDRFQPIGLKSAVKLQDLFVNSKIPPARRRALVLAATKTGDIFWVDGLRIGEQFKLTPETSRKLVWLRR
ncbi:MAG: tRNA lysidine(34) synthetase TilS [Verrucomicrobiota bacterium]